MGFTLGPLALRFGYRIAAYDAIGSTNTEALARARAGDPGMLWVVSREQTEGRGRRGRRWETPPGNLGASCLMVLPPAATAQAATLGFVAGLSLRGALSELVPAGSVAVALDHARDRPAAGGPVRFELKWPNDVVAAGAKLAGIMLESERLADGRCAVVTGIGVNVVAAPQGLPYPATSIHELGARATSEEVLTALAEHWCRLVEQWAEGRGLPAIREEWLAHASGLGGPVAVRSGERILRGTFETIDEAGRLVIRTTGGALERITAAEVHFGAVASAAARE